MNGRKKTGLSHRGLGIHVESKDYGKLMLAQKSETGEIFLLREKVAPSSDIAKAEARYHIGAGPEKTHTRSLMRLDGKEERFIGRAIYLPAEKSIYVEHARTEAPYLERGVASSLLAYIKTHGKDIVLSTTRDAERFYRKMGFVDAGKTLVLKLPAGKPLAKREGERVRKFLITRRKK